MTGHDLDLEACKRIPHPVAKVLVAEVESLRAKLDSAGRALAVMQNHEIRADQAEAKLVAAEQERDSIFGEALRYKRLRIEEKSRADRAEAALAAVRELADRTQTFGGSDIEGWVNLADLRHALAAAEQDEPGCLGDCGWKHCRPPCPHAGQGEPKREQS